jgi:hypothetical protein
MAKKPTLPVPNTVQSPTPPKPVHTTHTQKGEPIPEMVCATCTWFGAPKDHHCRRYPPAASVVYKSMSEKEYTTFPTVEPDWHCGEWKKALK